MKINKCYLSDFFIQDTILKTQKSCFENSIRTSFKKAVSIINILPPLFKLVLSRTSVRMAEVTSDSQHPKLNMFGEKKYSEKDFLISSFFIEQSN